MDILAGAADILEICEKIYVTGARIKKGLEQARDLGIELQRVEELHAEQLEEIRNIERQCKGFPDAVETSLRSVKKIHADICKELAEFIEELQEARASAQGVQSLRLGKFLICNRKFPTAMEEKLKAAQSSLDQALQKIGLAITAQGFSNLAAAVKHMYSMRLNDGLRDSLPHIATLQKSLSAEGGDDLKLAAQLQEEADELRELIEHSSAGELKKRLREHPELASATYVWKQTYLEMGVVKSLKSIVTPLQHATALALQDHVVAILEAQVFVDQLGDPGEVIDRKYFSYRPGVPAGRVSPLLIACGLLRIERKEVNKTELADIIKHLLQHGADKQARATLQGISHTFYRPEELGTFEVSNSNVTWFHKAGLKPAKKYWLGKYRLW